MTRVLFLMVARGGSKGVPGKNLRKLGGISLIGWKAAAAHAVMHELSRNECECRLVISTDSQEIADEARACGVEVPFMRPAELATDEARSIDVITHALSVLGEFDTVVLLEPSAPFTSAKQYLEAYRQYCLRGAHLVVGMKITEPHSSFIGEQYPDDRINHIIVKMNKYSADTRRQARAPEYTMNGSLYIFRAEVVTDEKFMWTGTRSIYNGPLSYGYLMDRWSGIEIDTPHDLEMAEYAVAKGYVTVPQSPGLVAKLLGKAML